ncbi:MAG: hypothetical protein ACE5KU_03960 [Nitrososphaerales archaeon]
MHDMDITEEEIRRAAETKQWVESRISELEGEIEHLRGVLAALDAVLRKTSFQPAAAVPKEAKPEEAVPPPPTPVVATAEFKEVRPLKRSKDGVLLANAYVSESSVAIVPVSDVVLKVSTPPFSSFFLNRILEGMKGKDLENVSAGRLKEDEVLNYTVEEEDEVIKKIVVNNYRDQSRLTEIFNTSAWTFARMLEKAG